MSDLIYQVAVGPQKGLYETCIDSVARYCDRFGIKHIVQREPILRIKPLNNHRSESAVSRLGYLPIYEKENSFSYLATYKNVAVIDADIYIRDTAPNIFDTIDDSTVFKAAIERDMPLTPKYKEKIRGYSQGQYSKLKDVNWDWKDGTAHFANMGLMVFTDKLYPFINGTPEEFIRRKEFERFVNGEDQWRWSTDQTLLNYWLKKAGVPFSTLDWRWNGLFGALREGQIDKAWFVHFFLSENLPDKGEKLFETIHSHS